MPGSPPRMRGKAEHPSYFSSFFRITPAYAGKSFLRSFSQSRSGDHPRVCGEKLIKGLVHPIWMGSPPRMRGKGIEQSNCRVGMRITPAYAGKRIICPKSAVISWDHPRVCGEKLRLPAVRFEGVGSPPHVRGKVGVIRCAFLVGGITPACAGKRLKRSRSTVPPVAIVPLFPSVCNKPVVSDGSPAGRDAPLFLPAENAVPASPAYNLRSL